ncbi:MAG TPA: DUF4398 domain-containing protein [Acidobacteriota bacterium]|jgi:hypothetical protein|nr:DUF4398 domain-containing protein [Acidobacteriota bacterium]
MKQGIFRLFLFAGCIFCGACQAAPEAELEAAQKQIEAARKAEADQFAPELLRSAEDLLSDASLKISEKSYREARILANQARAKAEEAEKAASERQAAEREAANKFQAQAERQLTDLKTHIDALTPDRVATRAKLQQRATELGTLLQLYKGKIGERRFAEARNMEGALRKNLQQLNATVETELKPEQSRGDKPAKKPDL